MTFAATTATHASATAPPPRRALRNTALLSELFTIPSPPGWRWRRGRGAAARRWKHGGSAAEHLPPRGRAGRAGRAGCALAAPWLCRGPSRALARYALATPMPACRPNITAVRPRPPPGRHTAARRRGHARIRRGVDTAAPRPTPESDRQRKEMQEWGAPRGPLPLLASCQRPRVPWGKP